MRLNTALARPPIRTFEGAPAIRITPEQMLRRSVLSCFLWEDGFYEDGKTIADRITELCGKVSPEFLSTLAIEARHRMHLRHAPLLLLCGLIKHGKGAMVSQTIEQVITRADELSELLALYWRDGKRPLSNQLKKGLAAAFLKFGPYQLAKYNRDNAIKLRDVLFLCHAKPDTNERAEIWKKLVANELTPPDTWEVALSGGANKRETFERLIREEKLGYLALLRNLRNMTEAGCDLQLVRSAITARKGADKVLPFRFVAAARACPQMEPELDFALCHRIQNLPALSGTTFVLVDVSPSMDAKLSAKSDLTRADAACTLASVINGQRRVFSFSDHTVEVPPRIGMSGVDAIRKSQLGNGTLLGAAVSRMNSIMSPEDRLIVITDEESADPVPAPCSKNAYMINVASHEHAVGYGSWTRITGFSENVISWIIEKESAKLD